MKILNLYACLGGNRYKWDETALGIIRKQDVNQVSIFDELGE
jgi:hypothetical protein